MREIMFVLLLCKLPKTACAANLYQKTKPPTSISGGFRFYTSGGVESPSEAPMFSFAERVH